MGLISLMMRRRGRVFEGFPAECAFARSVMQGVLLSIIEVI
jgi:hypothetical protein